MRDPQHSEGDGLEETLYTVATAVLFLILAAIALGIVLERTGLLPGAEQFAVTVAGVLFPVLGAAGLALLVLSRRSTDAT